MKSVYEDIFDCSPVAMLLVDNKSKIKLANRQARLLFKYEGDELVGQDVGILIPSETREKHPGLVDSYFQSPLPRQMGKGRTLFGIRKDGSKFPAEVGLNPIESEGTTYVMSSIIDITDRTRAEERFKAAVDAAPSGMIMINKHGIIELCNKKTEEIFGYRREELIGGPIEKLVPEDIRMPHPAFVKSYVVKPEPRAMGMGRELFGRHKSGRLVPVEIGLQPVYSGDEVFVISSVVDISLRREAEKEILEKSEEIREFSYRTSHDLKAPLLSIEGLADCIIEDIEGGDAKAASSNAEKVRSLTSKLNRLIEDILVLTRSDVESEEKRVFSFDQYVLDVQEKLGHSIKELDVEIAHSFLHKKELTTQNVRLTQVLDNLISNAIKYSHKREQKSYVRINTFNDNSKFYIQVEDNGEGIPRENQDEVFEMFKRFHSEKASGSGLGLYMVKKHMNKLGADISFESDERGTVFYLEFFL